jgi:hypothetical protein
MTPLGPAEAAKAIAAGYRSVVGTLPSPQVLALLLGQWALETGNGKYIHNYNFGNVKFSSAAPAKQYFRCSEIVGGVEVWYDPPAPECAFAAYQTAADGAKAYVETLKRRAHWWQGLQTGDVVKFNTALSTAPKYYTANPTTYLSALNNRVATYLPQARVYGASWGKRVGQIILGLTAVGGGVLGFRYLRSR